MNTAYIIVFLAVFALESISSETSITPSVYKRPFYRKVPFRPFDCQDIQWLNISKSGVYTIYPKGTGGFSVFCDLKTDGGGWTVLQRRINGSVGFNRDWKEYQYGFGKTASEYWIGNERIHQLVSQGWYEVRFDLEDFAGIWKYALYKLFHVGNRDSGYKLRIGDYSGNAGNSMTIHNGATFHTRTNDINDCSKMYKGGFWYKNCHRVNINGLYLKGHHSTFANGMNWYDWHGYHYSLKTTEMKIRRR